MRLAAGLPNMLEMSLFLLSQGIDGNIQNSKGCTALIQICHLMGQSPDLDGKLRPLADVIIRNQADLTISDEHGYSACTLIFHNRSGLEYLERFVCRYIDLLALHDMNTVDYWLITALARAYPTFQRCLEAENESYRTPLSLSSVRNRPSVRLVELDFDLQLASLKMAKPKHRTHFMQALCAKGTLEMVQPFLGGGLNLDEIETPSSRNYLRAAARNGNMEVVNALMEAGASVDGLSNFTRPYMVVNGVVDEIIERWHSVRRGRPHFDGHTESVESEFWILSRLLQNPTFRNPNVLLLAVWWELDHAVFEALLAHGCGRRDGQAPASWLLQTYGSEVIEAIKCDNPIVTAMLDYGLALEVEDNFGSTALIHALDKGRGKIDYTHVLIAAGADLERRAGCGYTPLDFAEMNMRARHPRMPQRAWNAKAVEYCNSRLVSEEEDKETYMAVKKAIKERTGYQATLRIPVSTVPSWGFRDIFLRSASIVERDMPNVGLTVLGIILTLVSLLWLKLWAFVWRAMILGSLPNLITMGTSVFCSLVWLLYY
ncbi:ankyrin repeat-containing domain protein [Lophiotrema nucula]|uniref:Ankyrin repeat-containing domain protein n=1 Tax=Lophiotrema nucula TaxID=690887 RepID=A0A6A5Z422_9PLEO|nr:ankyrin repeat-containing domain protein [Lophiotrema nucula]